MVSTVLDLSFMTAAKDLKKLLVATRHFRGEWLYGEGWNHNFWASKRLPTAQDIDEFHSGVPIIFLNHDGHSLWMNTKAIHLLQLKSGMDGVQTLPEGPPSGIVTGNLVHSILDQLPPPSHKTLKEHLLNGIQTFNQAGFTHIRDLSCSEEQWSCALELEQEGKLTLAVSQYLECHNIEQLDQTIAQAESYIQQSSRLLRFEGIKIYFDGSLGSDTALLSEEYLNSGGHGLQEISDKNFLEYIRRISRHPQLALAIHTLGDKSTDRIVSIIEKLVNDGRQVPSIHLEHLEVVRPETIEKMANLPISCHMQPIHYLGDILWLPNKLSDRLLSAIFPWAALEECGLPVFFGSDSPIEKSSLIKSHQSYNQSVVNGIPAMQNSFLYYHSHPDLQWVPDCSSMVDLESETPELKEVWFDGKPVF